MTNHTYRWSHPYVWLEETARGWSRDRLLLELQRLAIQHDSDTLQDLYQSEMDSDGYFDPIKPTHTEPTP